MEDLLIKAATVIAVALAAFSSFPGTAQQDQAAQQPAVQQPAVQQQSSPAQQTTSQDPNAGSAAMSSAAATLKPVSGELVNKLDSKSAKQGDSVVVKTDENLTISPGTDIPKGSKLVGRVTNVQPRGDGKENSQIAIQFDRAELKGGQTLPIESVIQSVAPSGDEAMNNSIPSGMGSMPASPGAAGTAGPGTPGMNPSAGGMNQGAAGNNRQGLAGNSTVQPGATDQNTNAAAPAPGSIVARNGNVAIRATAIPGVLLANDIHGLPFTNASGMLLGARRDVHLDGGTKFVLAVAMAPQGAGSGMNR